MPFCTDASLMDLSSIYIYTVIYICVYTYICIIYVYTCNCMCIYTYIYICILIILIFAYASTQCALNTSVSYSKVQQWMNLVAQVECSLAASTP